MRVLVTGASGFLGRAVAQEFAAEGHDVRTLQRRPSNVPDVSDCLGSITAADDVAGAVRDRDAVVHLAAKVSLAGAADDFTKVNVEGTRALLAAARTAGVERFVFVSSPSVAHAGASIVGAGASPADPVRARGHYARTKAEAELLALAQDSMAFRVVAVRPHLVWGPGDTQLVARVVERARANRLPLLGHGAALVDSTYIDNAASAIAAALRNVDDVHGRSFVITNGEPRPIAELIAGMCAAAGVPAPTRRVPAVLARLAGAAIETGWRAMPGYDEPPMTRFLAEQLSTAHWFDQRAARTELKWTPTVTLDEGFRRLAASFGTCRLAIAPAGCDDDAVTKGELNEPIEDGSGDASEGARVDGILEQVRRDLELGNADDAGAVLRERLDEAGIRYSDADLATLAERASNRS